MGFFQSSLFLRKELFFFNVPISMSGKRNVSTCSLTEARMAEVVSVSEPSPLEVVRPGLRELVFSEADEGWSGTGIAPAMKRRCSMQSDVVTVNRHNYQATLSHTCWQNENYELQTKLMTYW